MATLDMPALCTAKLPCTAARTPDDRFLYRLGHNHRHECAHESCEAKRWVSHDNNASCRRFAEVGLFEHTTCLAYVQGTDLQLRLAMTLTLQDVLPGKCPRRALAPMREPFSGYPFLR